MAKFKKGDRVKYSEKWLAFVPGGPVSRYAATRERDRNMRATVVGLSRDQLGAYIVKDGTKTKTLYAFEFLELEAEIEAQPEANG